MSVARLSVLFVIALIIFAVFLTPVSIIASLLTPPKGVAYQQLQGTLWQGKASALQVNNIVLNNVTWTLSVPSLLVGNADLDVKFGNARNADEISGKGNIRLGMSSIQANDLIVRVPAETVKPMLPVPVGRVGGRVILEVDAYSSSTEFVQNPTAPVCSELTGTLVWTKSEVVFNNPIRMGAISADLSCSDNILVARFNGDNELGLEGDANIASANQFNFDGFVKPQPHLPAEVHQGIAMFAKLDPQGRYPIKL